MPRWPPTANRWSTTAPTGRRRSPTSRALDRAAALGGPVQIRIAQGTYTPSKIDAPLDAGGHPVPGVAAGVVTANLKTFDLPNGVSLYGGFASGMKSLAQRDPAAYPTVLSGDLAVDDVGTNATGDFTNKADNAWHVVTLGDDVTKTGVSATLDGIQVIGGYANGTNNGGTLSPFIWGHKDGGVVYAAWGSNLVLNDDTFRGNFAASDGGGVFTDGCNLTAASSRFLNNAALVRAGGLEGLLSSAG